MKTQINCCCQSIKRRPVRIGSYVASIRDKKSIKVTETVSIIKWQMYFILRVPRSRVAFYSWHKTFSEINFMPYLLNHRKSIFLIWKSQLNDDPISGLPFKKKMCLISSHFTSIFQVLHHDKAYNLCEPVWIHLPSTDCSSPPWIIVFPASSGFTCT